MDPQFTQPVAEPRHLGARTGGARRAQPQFLHQDIGRGGEGDARLIRPQATTARPAELETIEEFLDPILDVPPRTVDPFVEEARRLAQIGHDEARVILGLAAGKLDDFRFDDDPVRCGPRGGGIGHVGIDRLGLAACGRALWVRLGHRRARGRGGGGPRAGAR